MSKKRKKHGYAERLKYMHMLENGYSIEHIHRRFGINDSLLGYLWARYKSEGPSGLLKKQNVKADYAFKVQVLRDIEENHLTLVDASLKYNVSDGQIRVWKRIAKTLKDMMHWLSPGPGADHQRTIWEDQGKTNRKR